MCVIRNRLRQTEHLRFLVMVAGGSEDVIVKIGGENGELYEIAEKAKADGYIHAAYDFRGNSSAPVSIEGMQIFRLTDTGRKHLGDCRKKMIWHKLKKWGIGLLLFLIGLAVWTAYSLFFP